MENSNTISATGTLMIKHFLAKTPYETVKNNIETHRFKMSMTTKYCLEEKDPFAIEVTISKKKNRSRLVKHILPLIENQTNPVLFVSPDECITWKETGSSFQLITITASFYNKDVLLQSVDNAYNDHKRLCSKITLQ
jgi:hypothetical protein